MSGIWKWSKTAASNTNADPLINWATGMAPSAVSSSARGVMAGVAAFRDDISGMIATTGTSTAYAVASNSGLSATPNDGTLIGFTPHATNGASATLAVDGGTAFALQSVAGTAIPAASLVSGSPYQARFNSSASAWIVLGFYGSPSAVPIGGIIDYVGTTAPNSNFALANGQAVSRTTYSVLFALISTTFGVGDGSTTFNLPDLRGRVIAGLDTMGTTAASRITSTLNFDASVMGATGGSQSHTLTIAELPVHTPSGTNAQVTGTISQITPAGTIAQITPAGSVSTSINNQGASGPAILSPGGLVVAGGSGWTNSVLTATSTFTGTPFTPVFTGTAVTPTFTGSTPAFTGSSIGSGTAHTILPPVMVMSKIIRIF